MGLFDDWQSYLKVKTTDLIHYLFTKRWSSNLPGFKVITVFYAVRLIVMCLLALNAQLKSYTQFLWITLWISCVNRCLVSVFIKVFLDCTKSNHRL